MSTSPEQTPDAERADKWQMVNLVRDALREGMTLSEMAQALGISRKRTKNYLAALTSHGRDFSYIWDSFIANTDLTSKELLKNYDELEHELTEFPAERLRQRRDAILKRMDLHREVVEMAIKVGYLEVEKERSRDAGEARLEKVAEAVMIKLMDRKRASDKLRAAQQAEQDAWVIEAEAMIGAGDGGGGNVGGTPTASQS